MSTRTFHGFTAGEERALETERADAGVRLAKAFGRACEACGCGSALEFEIGRSTPCAGCAPRVEEAIARAVDAATPAMRTALTRVARTGKPAGPMLAAELRGRGLLVGDREVTALGREVLKRCAAARKSA